MRQLAKKNKSEPRLALHVKHRLREGCAVLLASIACFFFVSLTTYNVDDPGWSHIEGTLEISNAAGHTGAWMADLSYYLFGYISYLIPILIIYSAACLFKAVEKEDIPEIQMYIVRSIGAILLLCAGCGLAQIQVHSAWFKIPNGAGGILGQTVGYGLMKSLNHTGTTLILVGILLSGATLLVGIQWIRVADVIGKTLWIMPLKIFRGYKLIHKHLVNIFTSIAIWRAKRAINIGIKNQDNTIEPINKAPTQIKLPKNKKSIKAKKPLLGKERQGKLFIASPKKSEKKKQSLPINPKMPALELLECNNSEPHVAFSKANLTHLSQLVEEKLLDFGIKAKVEAVLPGPVITRFELTLAPGVKASKLSSLAKDLARSLSLVSVRVVEVIPGKSYVGLEIPNDNREIVRLRELLECEDYQQAKSPVVMVLGKDISGTPQIADLSRMPHLLVAGTTGSGKSVGLNAMLLSMLYRATPQELRLILIDPKMLELSIYQGIPHLLTPVVTDMKDAQQALKWCVFEMERRYKLMAHMGVRNIANFNQKITDKINTGEAIIDPLWPENSTEPAPALEPFPTIVVVIDELADMMMVVGKKVEELIARIAQKARAAGIHLILATQRPSVDVLTGLIKANVPTRISFQVSSRIDSRTVLDQMGAEQLLGHGDMLYLPPGTAIPTRVHGAFVADDEVHAVVDYWRKFGEPDYVENIANPEFSVEGQFATSNPDEEMDELFDKAVFIVTESRRASISHLQRRLKIGYNRAARLIEVMEAQGIVSAQLSNGNREVLVEAAPK